MMYERRALDDPVDLVDGFVDDELEILGQITVRQPVCHCMEQRRVLDERPRTVSQRRSDRVGARESRDWIGLRSNEAQGLSIRRDRPEEKPDRAGRR
jgi:hypothetical protein